MDSNQTNQHNSPEDDGSEEIENALFGLQESEDAVAVVDEVETATEEAPRVNIKREPLDENGVPLSHYGRYKESHDRYAKSDLGKAARKRYADSDQGKAARKRYQDKRNAEMKIAREALKESGVNLGEEDPQELAEAIRLGKEAQAKRQERQNEAAQAS